MAQAKILIVEDEAIVALSIQKKLESLGYIVLAVISSGAEALQKAAKTSPDLVLMDITLVGDMDGIETARHIRDRFNIPVVYLTAHNDDNTLQRARLTEPLGYLLKPFNIEELHTTIDMALYKHQMKQKLREQE